MKVAHLVCTYPPYKGGMGNSVEYLTRSLNASEGCSATVITPLYAGISDFDKSVLHIKPFYVFGNAAILPQLLLRLRKFDLVHLHYPFYGTHLFVYLACLVWRKPLVLHYHMDTEAPGFKGLVFRLNRWLVEPLLLKQAKAIVGSSLDYLENSFISDYIRQNRSKAYGIPFGVRETLLAPLDGVQKTKAILFVSSLDRAHYFKGLNFLFTAFAALKSAGRALGWKLEIVGDGDLRKEYIETCMKLDILDSVDFLGRIDDNELKQKYREAGLLVLPSVTRGEAFGIVLIEAMISGTPVIASNLPGVRSVFRNNVDGILVEPSNTRELSEAIGRFTSDDHFRQSAGTKAREYALANYTPAEMSDKIVKIYEAILNK